MPRTAPRRDTPLRRPEINDAALEMIRAVGLDGLSLRRLAEELDVTAPALYAHMRNKSDLLASVAVDGFTQLLNAFDAVGSTDPTERLFAYARLYVEVALDDPELFRVMFVFRPDAVPITGADNALPAATQAFDKPHQAVLEGIRTGAIHPDRDPLLTTMTLWTCSHGLASALLLGQRGSTVMLPENFAELIDDAIHTMLDGLTLPPR
ncbi:MAG: TetR/AcrR family transcriptional regulator [Microthrixaceae bacterium]